LDYQILDLNRQALDKLQADKHLEVIPGATHLFEEPGTLEKAADTAADWFKKNL
jgi:putative phosphoribosyl transferase